jgi:hypothetical protein
LAEGAWRFISRFELINSVYANLERKSSELAEKLVDPKATATTKKDQLIVYLKHNLPLYNWSNLETNKELFKVVGTVIDLELYSS